MKLNPLALSDLQRRLRVSFCFAVFLLGGVSPAYADDFLSSSTLFRQLNSPMTTLVDGRQFREALESITQQAKLNLCLDRHVDPSKKIKPGQLGPTAYMAIKKIAEQNNCVVMPVANMVLVGSEKWVDATAASLIPLSSSSRRTIRWPNLATPSEALIQAVGETTKQIPKLPHDLWPESEWVNITRPTAVNLIYAQFGRQLRSHSMTTLDSIASNPTATVTRSYSAVLKVDRLIAKIDAKAKIREKQGKTEIISTSKAHRLATDRILTTAAAGAAVDPKSDKRRFSLTLLNKPADAVLQQIAQSSGILCEIDPAVSESCRKVISLEVDNKTLTELIEIIALKANVKAEWQPGKVRIIAKDQ